MLRNQRHNHHHQSIGTLLMAPRKEQPLRTVYFDPKRVGSYGGVDTLRRFTRMPRKRVAEWLSEQDAYTLHKPARRHFTRHRGWSTSPVAGRSRRSVAVEKGQQWYDLSPHGDRRLLESGLVCSHEEQVRGVVGSGA